MGTGDLNRAIFLKLIEKLRKAFPSLEFRIDPGPANEDASADIAKQVGLAFDVHLSLQGDELHLFAGSFGCDWFPCSDSRVAENYFDAVRGLLAGEYRILETYIGKYPVCAKLERPSGRDDWEVIARHINGLRALIPVKRTKVVLRNS